jgi:hypothetical protein
LYREFRGKDADAKHHMKRCGFWLRFPVAQAPTGR